MKRLIVTADDVGLDRGMTEGAIRAHRDGVVTACSIVANGRAFDEAVEALREVPSLEVGVHLTLVEERALTTGRTMPRSYVRFLLSRREVDVERELRAQIEKVLAAGLLPTHLNSHQHLHMLPRLFAMVTSLAQEFRIPFVRIAEDIGSAPPIRHIAVATLNRLGRRARRSVPEGLRTSGATIGIFRAGSLDLRGARRLLYNIPDGVTEMITHPGIAVRGYDRWGYRWDEETAVLCSEELRASIDSLGIRLIAPSMA
ncbi:MAG TPA: ChbG/HpnK family deacetylase [Thermoanaerobaculia bacterium]|nr:ChbG/HpnK family deacetylase [Thermoanaerobaculia bacterium]